MWSVWRSSVGVAIESVRMKCCTSSRYARRVRALFCFDSQISSSGMSASCASVETRPESLPIGAGGFVVSSIIDSPPVCSSFVPPNRFVISRIIT
jgi:hypothetical protein